MKGQVAANAVAIASLAREGFEPAGDLLFAATADELEKKGREIVQGKAQIRGKTLHFAENVSPPVWLRLIVAVFKPIRFAMDYPTTELFPYVWIGKVLFGVAQPGD